MRTLMIFKGLPGSGKSTLAAALCKREPKRWIRINRDDLRGMAVGPGNNPHSRNDDREKLVRKFKDELILQAFKEGFDVIVDDTNLVPMTVKKLYKLAASVGDVKVIEKGVNVDVKTCIERDSKRTGFAHVGEKVIKDMARMAGIDRGRKLSDKEAYMQPRFNAAMAVDEYVADPTLPRAVMCDLDGTLALMGNRSPYDAKDCDEIDLPNWAVINAVLAMHKAGYRIIFMSGRDCKYRPETVRFIEKYCRVGVEYVFEVETPRPQDAPIPYELHMRGDLTPDKRDMRKDSIIKQELFDEFVRGKYNVEFVLDDRDQVVDFWRSIGLNCFQVAPGAF